MAKKLYNIYCDESSHIEGDQQPFMLCGYVKLPYPIRKKTDKLIKAIKEKHNYNGELKWTNISNKTLALYIDILTLFFECEPLEFRAVITRKAEIKQSDTKYSFSDVYFRMYYWLIHPRIDFECNFNIYFDIKDSVSQKKLHTLRDYLDDDASIRNFQYMRSNESHYIQIADILTGALNYNLRVTEGDIPGTKTAKRAIIDLIKLKLGNLSLNPAIDNGNQKFEYFLLKTDD